VQPSGHAALARDARAFWRDFLVIEQLVAERPYIESYQTSQFVAACCTFGRSATPMFNTGSSTTCVDPVVRSSAARWNRGPLQRRTLSRPIAWLRIPQN
jgi:hypothetical protein